MYEVIADKAGNEAAHGYNYYSDDEWKRPGVNRSKSLAAQDNACRREAQSVRKQGTYMSPSDSEMCVCT